jgi:predicted O-methyltransferase YrrM
MFADKLRFLVKYLKYKLFAKYRKGYGIHSPFLYDLVRNVIYKNPNYYVLDDIAELRYDLLYSDEEIFVQDFGAGSKVMQSQSRKIKKIVKYSAVTEKYGEMLFRIIQKFKPNTILELGTSLGLGSLYMAKSHSKAKIYTIEGCSETAKKAAEHFKRLKAENIEQIIGTIDEKLPELLSTINTLDFVYFDGNHKKEATINYFEHCLTKINNETIFYFDDIHWSKGMEEAWKEIKLNKTVTLTVDLFFSGLVFFKKELSKQNFTVNY